MPTEKRARKRAAREAKQAAAQRAQRRRSTVRRAIALIVIVAVAGGIYALVATGNGKKTPVAANKDKGTTTTNAGAGTTTTAAPTTTTTLAAAQVTADATSVAAGCPSSTATALNKPKYTQPAMTIDTTKTYTATVKTDVGTFVITLDPKTAPIAVNSFVYLAQRDFFNCVIFHRVIPGFVVQGGDPTGTGDGGPGYMFTEQGPTKSANAADQYPLGSVAMANSSSGTTDPSTNGSQFFIVTGTQGEALPPDYVLFGQVTSGMSVVNQISTDGSSSGVPPTITHRMLTVTIAES
jgi:cyclophilin family peptidyl-prolyl cis-trans isomerase